MAMSMMKAGVVGAAALLAGVADAQAYQPVSMNSTNSTGSGAPMVDLGYVKYRGVQNATAGINYFRAIPFAFQPTDLATKPLLTAR